jgi:cell division protein FtsN
MLPMNTDSAPMKVGVAELVSKNRRFGGFMTGIILTTTPCDVTGLAVECAESARTPFQSVKMVTNKVFLVLCMAVVLGAAGCSRQQSDWEKTRTSNSTDAYELFLKKYPSGEFTAQAQARLKELYEEREWQKARDTDTVDAYQAFLKQYPEGKWTEEARIRVENFTLASAPSNTPGAGAPGAAAPGAAAPGGPAAAPSMPAPAPAKPAAAAATPAPPPRTPAPASAPAVSKASSGSYGVQLGAFKSGSAAANERWTELQKKYPSALAGLSPKVSPAKGSSGTLYRLQVANLSESRATSICKTLKSQSQACVLLHPGHTG